MRIATAGGLLLIAASLSPSAFGDPPSAVPGSPPAPSDARRAPDEPAGQAQQAGPLEAAPNDPRAGIVRLQRGERPLGYGFVLRGDGRILTALSAIGHGNFVRARFSDDQVLPVRVVASDRRWDLALLAIEGAHWSLGLRASTLDAAEKGVHLRRFVGRGRALSEGAVSIAGRQSLLGQDGALLADALLLGGRFADDELGSPICDDAGEVVAVLARACDPQLRQDCRLAPFGAPVSALKQFLRRAPARPALPAAWTGLRGVAAHSASVAGVRVISVEPGSPAAQAGLQPPAAPSGQRASSEAGEDAADVIVAVNDLPVTTPEELRDLINRSVLTGAARIVESGAATKKDAANENAASRTPPEAHVRLLVYGSGKFRQTELVLRAPVQLPAGAAEAPEPESSTPPPATSTPAAERASTPSAHD